MDEELELTGAELVAEHTGRPVDLLELLQDEGELNAHLDKASPGWRAFYNDPLVSDHDREVGECGAVGGSSC